MTLSSPIDCTLKVFDEDSTKLIEGICLQEFDKDCKPFIESFNWTYLPADFTLTDHDDAVSRPESISLTTTLNEYPSQNEVNLYPGVDISWSSPTYPSSRKNIKGYLLIVGRNGSVGCRMFKFNTTDKGLLKKKLRLQYDVPYLWPESDYEFKVYSMPPPDNWEDSQNDAFFVKAKITTGSRIKNYNNPGKWVPSVSISNLKNSSVEIKIGSSPAKFNLTLFEVQLVKYSHDQSNAFKKVNFTLPTNSQGHDGAVFFHNLEPDMYKAVIHVQDPFDGIDGKCLCWVTEIVGTACSFNCGSVQTQYINVTGSAAETTTTAFVGNENQVPKTTASASIENKTQDGPIYKGSREGPDADTSSKTGLIIGLTISFVVIITILVALVCIKFRRIRSTSEKLVCPEKPGPWQPSVKVPVTQLNTKTVLIASCEDNEDHTKFVHELAKFLKAHYCKVLFPPWEKIGSEYSEWVQWAQANLAVANFTLLVDSEKMEGLLSSFKLTRCISPNFKGNITDEISKLMRQNIEVNQEKYRSKIIMVHYREECGSSGQFSVPTTMKLPDAFPDLLCLIHDLHKNNMEAFSSFLPLSSRHYEIKESGTCSDLILALKAAQGKPFKRLDSGFGSDTDDTSKRDSLGSDQGSLLEEETPQSPINNSSACFSDDGQSIFTAANNPLNGGQSGTDCTRVGCLSVDTVSHSPEDQEQNFVSLGALSTLTQTGVENGVDDSNSLNGKQDEGLSRDMNGVENDPQQFIPPDPSASQCQQSNFADAVYEINSLTESTLSV